MFFNFLVQSAKTWKVLRQQFKLHFDKLPVLLSGLEASDNIDVEWPCFKSLMFLKHIFEKRQAAGNLGEPENTEVGFSTVKLASNSQVKVSTSDEEQHTQINHDDGDDISAPPTQSSRTPNVGQSSGSINRSSSQPIPRSSQKYFNQGYRKRSSQAEVMNKFSIGTDRLLM